MNEHIFRQCESVANAAHLFDFIANIQWRDIAYLSFNDSVQVASKIVYFCIIQRLNLRAQGVDYIVFDYLTSSR